MSFLGVRIIINWQEVGIFEELCNLATESKTAGFYMCGNFGIKKITFFIYSETRSNEALNKIKKILLSD